jgi:hypothetical protein
LWREVRAASPVTRNFENEDIGELKKSVGDIQPALTLSPAQAWKLGNLQTV